MVVAASNSMTKTLDAARNLLAASTTFQTWVDAAANWEITDAFDGHDGVTLDGTELDTGDVSWDVVAGDWKGTADGYAAPQIDDDSDLMLVPCGENPGPQADCYAQSAAYVLTTSNEMGVVIAADSTNYYWLTLRGKDLVLSALVAGSPTELDSLTDAVAAVATRYTLKLTYSISGTTVTLKGYIGGVEKVSWIGAASIGDVIKVGLRR